MIKISSDHGCYLATYAVELRGILPESIRVSPRIVPYSYIAHYSAELDLLNSPHGRLHVTSIDKLTRIKLILDTSHLNKLPPHASRSPWTKLTHPLHALNLFDIHIPKVVMMRQHQDIVSLWSLTNNKILPSLLPISPTNKFARPIMAKKLAGSNISKSEPASLLGADPVSRSVVARVGVRENDSTIGESQDTAAGGRANDEGASWPGY